MKVTHLVLIGVSEAIGYIIPGWLNSWLKSQFSFCACCVLIEVLSCWGQPTLWYKSVSFQWCTIRNDEWMPIASSRYVSYMSYTRLRAIHALLLTSFWRYLYRNRNYCNRFRYLLYSVHMQSLCYSDTVLLFYRTMSVRRPIASHNIDSILLREYAVRNGFRQIRQRHRRNQVYVKWWFNDKAPRRWTKNPWFDWGLKLYLSEHPCQFRVTHRVTFRRGAYWRRQKRHAHARTHARTHASPGLVTVKSSCACHHLTRRMDATYKHAHFTPHIYRLLIGL